jgi:uncharacterized membrane protein
MDTARALGVVAMVMGHTLDALLSEAARATPAVAGYWNARGFTAPLFMIVAGWSGAVAIERSDVRGLAMVRGRLRRVLLLFGIGYVLHWPGWGLDRLLAGDREVWAHLLAFDALHAIALALLVSSLVLALPWSGRGKAIILLALAALASVLGAGPRTPVYALPAPPIALALFQAGGGTSPFPVFPWAAYFFVGGAMGLLAPPGRAGAIARAAAGGGLVLATCWAGVGSLPPEDTVLHLHRVGVVLVLLASLSSVPPALASRLAPLGRASLWVYAIHVPIVYGWSTFPGLAAWIGPRLGVGAAIAVGVAVLAMSFAFQFFVTRHWRARTRRPLDGLLAAR